MSERDFDRPDPDTCAMVLAGATLLRVAALTDPAAVPTPGGGDDGQGGLWLHLALDDAQGLGREEAMIEACALLLGRLLSRRSPRVTQRQVAALDRIGRAMFSALARSPASLDESTLEDLRNSNDPRASSAAMKLLESDPAWLIHPLVVVQIDRWRRAEQVKKIAGYCPKRYADRGRESKAMANQLRAFADLLVDRSQPAAGDKVNEDLFLEVHRDIQQEVARVRGAFEAWLDSGEVTPEDVEPVEGARVLRTRLRGPTWLADRTLLRICTPMFHDLACIRAELLEQYEGSRATLSDRTVRSWVSKHIPKKWRPIPAGAVPRNRSLGVDALLRPASG